MNRDALAYLQVSRAASPDKQTLSWTMHVPLRKFLSSAKFLLKTTPVIFATTPRPLSHAHPKFKLADCRTTMQKHCGTSTMLQVRYSYTPRSWLLLGKHTCTNVCAKPLKQRGKHHVQEGRPMAELSLAATKESEVEPHDDITFVYWSVMTPLLVYWSK